PSSDLSMKLAWYLCTAAVAAFLLADLSLADVWAPDQLEDAAPLPEAGQQQPEEAMAEEDMDLGPEAKAPGKPGPASYRVYRW
ncbi:hypothetical protein BOX15_Mlig013626g1, partial [Macrostomum lignano]